MNEADILEYINLHYEGLQADILDRLDIPSEWLFLRDEFVLAELIALVCEALRLDWEEVASTITYDMAKEMFDFSL